MYYMYVLVLHKIRNTLLLLDFHQVVRLACRNYGHAVLQLNYHYFNLRTSKGPFLAESQCGHTSRLFYASSYRDSVFPLSQEQNVAAAGVE